jgi:hypothetical protein
LLFRVLGVVNYIVEAYRVYDLIVLDFGDVTAVLPPHYGLVNVW